MKIKRYFAPDVRQAMRMVRDAQGPDAVILSNKRVDGGIEIVAAIDYDESAFRRTSPVQPPEKQTGQNSASERVPESQVQQPTIGQAATQPSVKSSAQPKIPLGRLSTPMSAASRYEGEEKIQTRLQVPPSNIQWGQEPAIVEMQTELKSLRGMLEKQLSGLVWDEFTRRNPRKAELIQQLMALGLGDSLCKALAEEVPDCTQPDDLFRSALECFSRMIPVANDEILNEGGVVALVGPTGVGKTTTAAKLAARYALRHGNRHVALVTIDNYRVCAHEQLRTYGRILDIPVKTADSREELRKVLDDLCDRRLVLIDTAGMSQRDSHLSEQASMLCGDDMFIKTSLVVSATSQISSVQEVMNAFGLFNPVSVMMTKLDEATSFGGALDMAIQYGVPISYLCDGQQVPEDMHLARAYDLVNRCVDITERSVPGRNGDSGMEMIAQSIARGTENANV
ncbi:Flagellar biosynthesis protein FlhF [hydrothermal vent metagenome]|uniref:Flagellar biosynthesis protein FlhF n=1 Tax=hydrothermal vent metagenome TaxID=652676 RepID=A0A3B0ZL05_9ZZZZ